MKRRRVLSSALLVAFAGCDAPASDIQEADAYVVAVEGDRLLLNFMKRPNSLAGRYPHVRKYSTVRVKYRSRPIPSGLPHYEIVGLAK